MYPSAADVAKTLLLVQVCFRHGDRTPATSYPNDPNRDHTFPPYGRGELTLKGKRNALNLGKSLRSLYGRFLGETYSRDLLESFSSPSGRAQTTLQCVHAGLFPPVTENQKVDRDLNWQPIGYHTFTVKDDRFLGVHISMSHELDVERQDISEEKRLHYQYLSEKSGMTVATSHNVFDIQNAILTQLEFGIDVPKWSEPLWPEPMRKYTKDFWEDLIEYKLPLFVGPLIELITDNAKAKISGQSSRKMFLYAGHELNIYLLLGALGNFKGQTAEYCSAIIWELHKINENYGFKIWFWNGNEKQYLMLPNVQDEENFIPFDKFVEFTNWLYEKKN